MDRRTFVAGAAVTTALGLAAPRTRAYGWVPSHVGVELISVDKACKEDLPGTLRKLRAIGYEYVEFLPDDNYDALTVFGRTAGEMRRLLDDVGLSCKSFGGEVPMAHKILSFAHEVGAEFAVSIYYPNEKLTSLDDFRRFADVLNRAGEEVATAGMRFAHHSHNFEYRSFGKVAGIDEVLQHTDPKLVSFEMDVFWAVQAGKEPLDYLRRYPRRFSMMHLKDRKPAPPSTEWNWPEHKKLSTEIGNGTIDFARILHQANDVKYFFVEQEEFERPQVEAVEISFQALQRLKP